MTRILKALGQGYEAGPENLQILVDVPERERQGAIRWHPLIRGVEDRSAEGLGESGYAFSADFERS